MTSATVIRCLTELFVLFGLPNYIHSDRGTSFLSVELRTFLLSKGVASSRTTGYNPQGNGQAEKFNHTVWKGISLSLNDKGLSPKYWQSVLPDVLHAIRSLLCTATNETPHERLFGFTRTSSTGASLPSWLTEGETVLLKRHVRLNKTDPYVDEVELVHTNPSYAHIKHSNGREAVVSLKHLAPKGTADCYSEEVPEIVQTRENDNQTNPSTDITSLETLKEEMSETPEIKSQPSEEASHTIRRSGRISRPPDRLKY